MKPIKIGIVGLGRAGWGMHCDELDKRKDKFVIVAACDIEKDRIDRMASRYGCRTYLNIDDFLSDPDMEMASIATRSPSHVEHAIKAFKAGKMVFLEKPVALSTKETAQLMEAVKQFNGKIFFRHNRRYEPAFQHVREIIASGILGNVYEIKLHRLGYQRRDDWQTIKSCGGGQLNNWGPHLVDHALQLLESPVAEVWSDLKKVAAVGDAEDHVNIILKGKNGRVVQLEISGGTALSQPEYVVFGDRGALTSDGNDIKLRYIRPDFKTAERKAIPDTPPMSGSFGTPETLPWIRKTIMVEPELKCDTDTVWDYLFSAVREGKPYPITTEQALEVVRIAELARKGTSFA